MTDSLLPENVVALARRVVEENAAAGLLAPENTPICERRIL